MKKLAGLLMLLASGAACAGAGAGAAARGEALEAAVAFWTAGYTGEELASGNFGCAAPEVPAVSQAHLQANQQIRAVHKAIVQWEKCHDGFMAGLRATPAETRIPAEVLASMTPAEQAQAREHVQAVQARVAQAAQANAAAMMARHETWLGATVEYVARQNSSLRRSRVAVARNEASTRFERESEKREMRERARAGRY